MKFYFHSLLAEALGRWHPLNPSLKGYEIMAINLAALTLCNAYNIRARVTEDCFCASVIIACRRMPLITAVKLPAREDVALEEGMILLSNRMFGVV